MCDKPFAIHSIFKKEAIFIGGSDGKWMPSTGLPEVAFFGRSNVGKSSLLNQLCNRKNLCRVSKTPGRTTTINFFNIGDRLILVDLPGYGYAKRSIKERVSWMKNIKQYFCHRDNLCLVCILIDSRHGMKPIDLDIIEFLYQNNIEYQIILTKSDKIKKTESIIDDCQKHLIDYNYTRQFIFNSSRKNYGAEQVKLSLAKYCK